VNRFRRIGEYLLCFLFPERCIFCNQVIQPLQLFCEDCRETIATVRPPVCLLCGHNKDDCSCKGHRHPYDAVIAPFYYEESVSRGILRLKTWDDPRAIRFFSAQMAAALRREYPDLPFDGVCYVPMTKRDRRRREYNQSHLLARELSRVLQMPLYHSLVKLYETKSQKSLKRAQRSGNVLGAFDVRGEAPGKSLLLVDDVVTTGATVSECAKMLKLAGAETITVVTIAVSAPQREEENEKATAHN
jgi:ComF family protein